MSGPSLLTPEKLLAIATLVGQYETPFYDKTPSHTSVLTGSHYVEELLSSKNHQRIFDVLRMPLATFLALRDWCIDHDYLQPTRHMSVEEQLAIFLKIVGENATNRMAQERFQRSGDTISRAFNNVLDAMVELYTAIVKQPAASQPTPPRIRNDPKMFPYFKDCLGAADGTHIHAHIPDGN